ncbi:hypothetical protein ABZ923_40115 [Streptomyces sp. NPDC046881]|uniref:hypothetical protein n=1 Tax=Streptomyces sp. NPDC046881 TaxID=3155374 RepID=UPI0033DE4CBD
MTTTTDLHARAGVIPVRSASGVLPHYAKEEGARALCGRPSGRRMTNGEADFAERFCAPCTKAAEKLAAANPQEPDPLNKPKEREPQIVTVARAFAAAVEPGDRNAEINRLADEAGVDIVHGRRDFDPHFAAPGRSATLCEQDVDRHLNEEQKSRISVLCPACEETGQHRAASRRATAARDEICAMRQRSHAAAQRVRIDPDPANPEWKAALDELTAVLDWLAEHDPISAQGIAAADAEFDAAPPLDAVLTAQLAGDTAPGSAPKHREHPDVLRAREALAGLACAWLSDDHDLIEPTAEQFGVRGFAVEPRGHGRVAFYWLESGEAVRRDHPWHGPCLPIVADRLAERGWSVEEMTASAQCVFATAPQSA